MGLNFNWWNLWVFGFGLVVGLDLNELDLSSKWNGAGFEILDKGLLDLFGGFWKEVKFLEGKVRGTS